MIHVDVKKSGNIPNGGLALRRQEKGRTKQGRDPGKATEQEPLTVNRVGLPPHGHRQPLRIAYSEIHGIETTTTAVKVLKRALSWFAARGVTVERVLSGNRSACKSHLWRDTCRELDIKAKKTRPYRPQTNEKIERFHCTLDGWAFKRFYATESAAKTRSRPGCTDSITTGPTPQSEARRPSAD